MRAIFFGFALLITAHVGRAQTPTITAISAPRQVVTLGQNLTLSVTATSATTPTYQWKRNGLPITGATAASYAITSAVPARDNGWYQVVVSNSSAVVTSAVVFVNVAVNPANVVGIGGNGSGQTTIPAGLGGVVAVAAGYSHSLALQSAGTVVAWGYNGYGQSTTPSGLSSVVAVAGGVYHSLALKSDGTVIAWGSNGYGQTTIPPGLSGVVAMAVGRDHNLVLKSDGTVMAWGYNGDGQTTVPTGLSGVVGLAAGSYHSLALKSDGTVIGWGRNDWGQTTMPAGLSGVVAMAADYSHTVALKSDGTVTAWGSNGDGETTIPSGLGGVVAVAAGYNHSLALKSDGTVVAWGNNSSGQAVIPPGTTKVTHIAAGGAFSLFLRDGSGEVAPTITAPPASRAANLGQVVTLSVAVNSGGAPNTYQWRKDGTAIPGATSASYTIGEVVAGSAGSYDVVVTNYLGTATSSAAALTVNASPVVSAAGGGRYVIRTGQSLTLTLDASIGSSATVQWKRNGVPLPAATTRTLSIAAATSTSAGYYQAIYNEGSGAVTSAAIFVLVMPGSTQLVGWGSNSFNQLTFPVGLSTTAAIATKIYSSFALKSDGTVVNWGYGNSAPSGLGNVATIAIGYSHYLALKTDGTVVQWGSSSSSQGSPPAGLSNVVAIAAGNYHSLALKADATVVAWGSSDYGATAVPVGLTGVVGIAAGNGFSLALKSDGTVVGWGNNGSGQSSVPPSIGNVIAISAGNNFSLALKSDGTVSSWGASGTGPAVLPAGLSGVVAIMAGNSHALALRSDGSVVAWGGNNYGQTTLPAGLNSVVAIAAGESHSLALRDSSGDLVPTIFSQPASVSAFAGQDVTLSVSVTAGTSLLAYQWRMGGVAIAGATRAMLVLPQVSNTSGGSYDVVVSNQLGAVTSQAAILTVNPAPAVATNVTGRQVVAAGQSLTLTATAAIAGPVTYQWRRNGLVIPGATNASFTIGNATWRNAGVYQVVAANSVGPVVSAPVFVSVTQPAQLLAWGNNASGQITLPVGLAGVTAVAAGSSHSLALKSDGTVSAWGSNTASQTNLPADLASVVALAANANYSLALKGDGTVASWGSINYVPSGLTGTIAIAAGWDYAMALRFDGTVSAWMSGNVATDVPADLRNAVAIAAGSNHRLALKSDGTVIAWGYNFYSQATVPAGLTGVVAIASGYLHSLALKSDGTVVAWGDNGSGQTSVPPGLGGVVAIAASSYTSFAVKSDGTIVAWGSNNYGLNPPPPGLANVFALTAGDYHALSLRDVSADIAPSITTQPASQAVLVGQSVTLSVSASGTASLTYQWRKNGINLAGATNATLTLTNLQSAGAGSYDVVVTNFAGSATSSAASITVSPGLPPIITSHPQGGAVFIGGLSNFVSVVSSSSAVTYQWRFNGDAIAGATAPSYAFNNTQLAQAGSYDVVVTNVAGSVTSQAAILTVLPPLLPSLINQPVSVTQFQGGAVSFSVTVSGTPPFSYQWRKNGGAIAGATNPAFGISNAQLTDAGNYDVVVSNTAGSATSTTATLTIAPPTPPTITSQPVGGTLNVTNVALFRVTATGSPTLFYQWRKNGVPIPAATSSTYIIGPVATTHAGTYDVVVSNSVGSVSSTAAVLIVNPPALTITSQPVSVNTFLGGTGAFSVTATGSPSSPTLQWRKDGIAIPGATASSLVFSSVQLTDAGTYDVVASNAFATVTSTAATLTVGDTAPQITVPPVGTTLAVGGNVTLSFAAVGSMPLAYQWRRNGLPISGATSTTFTISNAQSYHTGVYDVVVTNALGSATSTGASVNVVPRVVTYSARLMIDSEGSLGVFTIEGTLSKKVLLRAVGPGLAPFGLSGLPDPQLELFDSSGALVAINNDWSTSSDASAISSTTAAVGAFALAVGSRDSAIIRTLPPGTYTVRAAPASGVGGTGYLELYDADLATAPMSTLPYVAIRGKMAAGGGVVIGGLGSNGRGQRSYLVRAIGPALGLPGALANPAMLIVRDSTLVGSNNDWDANPAEAAITAEATARVTAFALPAGGRDSALVLTGNLHAGACTVQVGGSDALGGMVLLELHDLDVARPASFPPIIASAPVHTTVAAGEAAALRVLVHGSGPLNYQWHKDGVPIAGATAATFALSSAQATNGGSYTVVVSNSLGAATSLPATLTVQGSASGSEATQALIGSGYGGGGTVTISNTLLYAATPTSLGWSVTLPAGWSFVSDGGAAGDVKPAVGATGTLEWAWSNLPASPLTFTYTVRVPVGATGDQMISAAGIVRFGGSISQPVATPSPLLIPQITTHSADTNADFRLSLLELTRVIELYNTRNGTTRTGCYAVAASTTEDGFAIDSARASTAVVPLARYHSGDSNRDGKLSLLELTRIIELYNTRSGTTRTGAYHAQPGTEDSFAPGP